MTINWSVDKTKTLDNFGLYQIIVTLIDGSQNPVYDPNNANLSGWGSGLFIFGCPATLTKTFPYQTCNETGCGAGHETCQYHGSVTCTYGPTTAPTMNKGTWDCRLPDNTQFHNLTSDQWQNGVLVTQSSVPLGTSFFARVGMLGGGNANPYSYDYQYTSVTIN
jgi:hypothetical protein